MDENKEIETKEVPYIVYESSLARAERHNKRLFLLCIIIFISLVATNAGWIIYESQWVDEEVIVTQENEGGYNNYIGNDGDIINGETDYNTENTP